MEKEGVVTSNPCKDVDTPKTDTEERKPLTGAKVHELLSRLDPAQPSRWRLLIALASSARRRGYPRMRYDAASIVFTSPESHTVFKACRPDGFFVVSSNLSSNLPLHLESRFEFKAWDILPDEAFIRS